MLQLLKVTKRYPGEKPSIDGVTLALRKGEFAFLTGPSGAGKSTLMRLVVAAERPTSGKVLVLGRDVSRTSARQVPYLRRAMGVVFQDFKLLTHRTAAENIAAPLEVRGVPRSEVRRRVEKALRGVGLELKGDKFPPALSGGEQQRVAVARALVGDPALLLADEPTGNLDPERTLEVMELLHAAHARGTTVLVATHDRSLLERFTRRVIALDAGRVVSDGLGLPRGAPA